RFSRDWSSDVCSSDLPEQRKVFDQLARLSDRLVTMSEKGESILREVYDVPEEKIALIPHGIPDIPFVDPNFYKDKFGVAGRPVKIGRASCREREWKEE